MNAFPERAARLHHICASANKSLDFPLIFGEKVAPDLLQALQIAVLRYVQISLYHAFEMYGLEFTKTLIDDNWDMVKSLPNITPNGLILPKRENYLAYHEIHRVVAEILVRHGIDDAIRRIHSPLNIRLVHGNDVHDRPKASTKLHTDIWAGEFADSLMIFLPILGDIKNIGVEFFEPPASFSPEWVKPLADYAEGAWLEGQSTRYDCELECGNLYVLDSFLLHRTVKRSNTWRLGLDWRFLPQEAVDSDTPLLTPRLENYIPFEEWRKIGTTKILYTDLQLGEFEARDPNAYAAQYRLITLNE